VCNDEHALDGVFSTLVAVAGLSSGYNREIALRVFKTGILAMKDYEPAAYSGSVVEIRAKESLLDLGQTLDKLRPFPATPEKVITLPGTHNSIMNDSNRTTLAAALDNALGNA
jgi:hypothetical protein